MRRIHAGTVLGLALLPLLGASIASAQPAPPFVCGVLEYLGGQRPECLSFRAMGSWYWLDDYGTFAAGDTVRIVGVTESDSVERCGFSLPWIHVQSIDPCHGFDFGCGVLTFDDGDGCGYFESFQYGPYLIDRRDSYRTGDTLSVKGGLALECLTWCTALGCITADSLAACKETATAPLTWGALKALFR